MESFKTYYGAVNVNIKDLIETNQRGFMKLEYYGTKKIIQNKFVEYGIEIVKKEYVNNCFKEETNKVNNIAESDIELETLIELLKRNKVTPMSLENIIYDLAIRK